MSNKKVVFSIEIDNTINGFAVGISFLAIGLFLLFQPSYFPYPIISYIFGAIIGFLGMCGTTLELSKVIKIKGIGNFILGIALLLPWLYCYISFSSKWVNGILFVFLLLGSYAACRGFIEMVYSIYDSYKNNKTATDSKANGAKMVSQIILLLTQICALVVAIMNVLKAANH